MYHMLKWELKNNILHFYEIVVNVKPYFWHVCRDSVSDAMAASMSLGSKVMPACITKMLL